MIDKRKQISDVDDFDVTLTENCDPKMALIKP